MHNCARKAPKPKEAEASAAQSETLNSLQSQFLSNHHNNSKAQSLEINVESYMTWNYRKLVVEDNLSQVQSDHDSIKSILDAELGVVESAMRQNFRFYGAWHHRKWFLSKGHSSIENDIRLLEKFQKADS